jgi:hypothetical protein
VLQVVGAAVIAYYPFDGNALDASGGGRHGVVRGATLTADRLARPNSAYRFGGTAASFIDIGALPLAGNFTIAGYLRADTVTFGSALVSSLSFADNAGYELLALRELDGRAVRMHTAPSVAVTSTTGIQPGQWHFLTATFRNGVGSVYLDGQLVATRSGMTSSTTSPLPTLIGKSAWNGNFVNGAIDEVSIFAAALTPGDVESLFRAGGRP